MLQPPLLGGVYLNTADAGYNDKQDKGFAWPTPNCLDVNAFSYTCMAAISVVHCTEHRRLKDRLTSYTMNARDRVRKRQIVTEDIISGRIMFFHFYPAGCTVDACCLEHVLGKSHKAGDVDQDHIACQLPY